VDVTLARGVCFVAGGFVCFNFFWRKRNRLNFSADYIVKLFDRFLESLALTNEKRLRATRIDIFDQPFGFEKSDSRTEFLEIELAAFCRRNLPDKRLEPLVSANGPVEEKKQLSTRH
jgi:hypothetical protein